MSEPRAVVIAHGKSEVILAKRIANRLGMGLCVYSKKNGEETIRISDLPELFEKVLFPPRRHFIPNSLNWNI